MDPSSVRCPFHLYVTDSTDFFVMPKRCSSCPNARYFPHAYG